MTLTVVWPDGLVWAFLKTADPLGFLCTTISRVYTEKQNTHFSGSVDEKDSEQSGQTGCSMWRAEKHLRMHNMCRGSCQDPPVSHGQKTKAAVGSGFAELRRTGQPKTENMAWSDESLWLIQHQQHKSMDPSCLVWAAQAGDGVGNAFFAHFGPFNTKYLPEFTLL